MEVHCVGVCLMKEITVILGKHGYKDTETVLILPDCKGTLTTVPSY